MTNQMISVPLHATDSVAAVAGPPVPVPVAGTSAAGVQGLP